MGNHLIPIEAIVHPVFKTIACHPDGSIYSLKTGKKRSLWKTKHGYLQLAIGRTSYLSHRLIADTFIEKPTGKNLINHKNGIKDDNRVENLEWCTQEENVRHARDILGIKFSLPGFESPTRSVSEKEIRIMVRLFTGGMSICKISEILEYAEPTITRYLKECSVGRSDFTRSARKK